MPITSLEDSFETLTKAEWDRYLLFEGFNGLRINPEIFVSESRGEFYNCNKFKMRELIDDYNDELFSLKVSYCLCKHYFDKGIPDEPYLGEMDNGLGTKYYPNFQDEHWMRRYWFCYFADVFYLKFSSLWDAFYYVLAHCYNIDEKHQNGHNDKVLKKIKLKNANIYQIIHDFRKDQTTIESNKYRNYASHGSSTGAAHDKVKIVKHESYSFPVIDCEGNSAKNSNMERLTVTRKAVEYIYGYGDSVSSLEIVENIIKYTYNAAKAIGSAVEILQESY